MIFSGPQSTAPNFLVRDKGTEIKEKNNSKPALSLVEWVEVIEVEGTKRQLSRPSFVFRILH